MGNPLEILDGYDAGKVLALIARVGGREVADAIVAGKKKVTTEDIIPLLIGKNVRLVIPAGFLYPHVDLNPAYYWEQPAAFDIAALIERMKLLMPQATKFPDVTEVTDGLQSQLEQLVKDERVSNLVTVKDPRRGIRVPWILPQMEVDPANPGKAIAELFVPGLKLAYEKKSWPKGDKRIWTDYLKDQLDRQVKIAHPSQLRLIEAINKGPVYGWIFPAVFQGIGIEGDRALMECLPKEHGFVLGGFESLAAMMLHTAMLARDVNTPVMDLAAFEWRSSAQSLYLFAFDAKLELGSRILRAHGYCSAALSVFRQAG